VPRITSQLVTTGLLPATNRLQLAIGLPLRDQAGLSDFLAELYDPSSPNFRKFLSPAEFAARFGPSVADYTTVENFARANGLTIARTHGNRLLLDVSGPVAAINHAFHITLRTYRHPTEHRNIFAPDTEPMVDAQLPVTDISGLDNSIMPRPQIHPAVNLAAFPQAGSGAYSSYLGNDFRAAYVPGTTLTGAGQRVGLLEFDGYYAYDIAYYATQAGITNVPVQPVILDGVSGVPSFSGDPNGNSEVSLDIEMAMAMAPGLADIVVFEGNNPNDILNAMVASNQVAQLSSSWTWGGGPSTTTDNIFQEMAAQGQSFFVSSGDALAYTSGANSVNGVDNPNLGHVPDSSPYVTTVGATTLSTSGPGGVWTGETVWNNGQGGSGGGVSSYYPIPAWQTNVSMAANGGSTVNRNIPDVAMAGDNVLVYYGDGTEYIFAGTSCAAPLWAGFTALANQQAATFGAAPLGFLNPALYGLLAGVTNGAGYAAYFGDVTTGNNTSSDSPNEFFAVAGYDLCTGLGTPSGTNLINALTGLDDYLQILPGNCFAAFGAPGGPFTPGSFVYTLTNSGATSLTWSVGGVPSWLNLTSTHGILAAAAFTNISLSLNSVASNLLAGTYTAMVQFTNLTSSIQQNRLVTLQIVPPMQVTPTNLFAAAGPFGGPFNPATTTLTVSNLGGSGFNWSLLNTSVWLTASATSGVVSRAGPPSVITLNIASAGYALPPGLYAATLVFTNTSGHAYQTIPVSLSIGQNQLVNGGFETGDFTGWTLVGDPVYGASSPMYFDAVVSAESFVGASGFVHSGGDGAIFGEFGYLATLSQTIATLPGQDYLLSFWLLNNTNQPTAEFEVNWAGTTIENMQNPAVFGWTNQQFIVSGSGPATVLQFAAENDTGYFGLDDVSLIPIPNPGLNFMAAMGNSIQFAWSASPGLVYQVQYKTNLVQSAWVNLGTPVMAGTNIVTFSDTNTLMSAPQRFYRLEVSP
jgi:hypothetical protein